VTFHLAFKRLTPTAKVPHYATPGSAGADLHADIQHQVVIGPGERATIPTGIGLAIPAHLAVLICPRSGLSHKNGVTVHNGPGVIDSDYRDGLGVILHNTTHQQFVVNPGDRIAQMLIVPVLQAEFEEVDHLGTTDRNGGFGSTGVATIEAPTLKGALPGSLTQWLDAAPAGVEPELLQ
jgi:dUTP pyrophosphatase